jgi:hypothetical protein
MRGLKVMFADDLSAAASALDVQSIEVTLNHDMRIIAAWAKRKGLKISPEKSQVTFFTPDRRESFVHPQIFFEGELIKLERNPTNFGLFLDSHHTGNNFKKHKLGQIPSRAKVIKAMTNPSGGLSMEDALMTYRATVEPVIGYLNPIFKPIISKTWIAKLQFAQNKALRHVTGCHAVTSMDHLHQECKLMPVDQHLDLLATRVLANALQPHHSMTL